MILLKCNLVPSTVCTSEVTASIYCNKYLLVAVLSGNVAGIVAGSVVGAAALVLIITALVLHARKQKRFETIWTSTSVQTSSFFTRHFFSFSTFRKSRGLNDTTSSESLWSLPRLWTSTLWRTVTVGFLTTEIFNR